jgi:pimeloyl-ACP methyl ester carboxylesterase
MGDRAAEAGASRHRPQRRGAGKSHQLHYAIYGQASPVIFLHGGLANTDYWGRQVPAVAAHHTVILMDSRGHGRSTRDAQPYGYDLMADDVVALMDSLKIARADIVGWSDGGILGIDLAIRHDCSRSRLWRA